MNNPPLKLSLPSDMSDDFCSLLTENGISYTSKVMSSGFRQDGMGFIVNSSSDVKEIIIAAIESASLWGAIGTAIIAFTKRHKHKSVTVEKDGFKFKASGMSQDELAKSLEGATKLLITTSSPED